MTFFNEVLLARNAQGTIESILGRSKKRLVAKFKDANGEEITQTTIFDIQKTFNYKQSIKVTENPVEQGVNINDHRIQQAMEFTMDVGVSNIIDPLTAAAQLNLDSLKQAASLQIFGNKVANTRIQVTYNQLQIMMQNSEPLDIDTPMGLLKNFVITEIDNTNDGDSITTFEGSITFKEILFFNNLIDVDTAISGINKRTTVTVPILSSLF